MIAAKFIAEKASGLLQVMDELCFFGRNFGSVMIDDQPIGLIQPRLKAQVRDPGGSFFGFALAPAIVVISLQRDIGIEDFACQALQQDP